MIPPQRGLAAAAGVLVSPRILAVLAAALQSGDPAAVANDSETPQAAGTGCLIHEYVAPVHSPTKYKAVLYSDCARHHSSDPKHQSKQTSAIYTL